MNRFVFAALVVVFSSTFAALPAAQAEEKYDVWKTSCSGGGCTFKVITPNGFDGEFDLLFSGLSSSQGDLLLGGGGFSVALIWEKEFLLRVQAIAGATSNGWGWETSGVLGYRYGRVDLGLGALFTSDEGTSRDSAQLTAIAGIMDLRLRLGESGFFVGGQVWWGQMRGQTTQWPADPGLQKASHPWETDGGMALSLGFNIL